MGEQTYRNEAVSNVVYDSNLIDRTFYDGDKNDEFLHNLKIAKEIYLRTNKEEWKRVSLPDLDRFFKDNIIISSGLVAIPQRRDNQLVTQYCAGLICQTDNSGTLEADIEFYIEWNDDFTLKK